jgi:tetratricopeptide (TPR) repeat protein
VKPTNFSKWVKAIILLVCLGGITGLGIYYYDEYRQIQQAQQADRLLARKKYSAAVTAYDRLLQINTEEQHLLWINRGYAFLGLKQYDRMLESCSQAISIVPNTAFAWNCRGEALYYLKRDREALSAFERATALDSQKAIFWLNKAVVLDRLKQYEKAILASDRAVELLPESKSQDLNYRRQQAIAFNQKGQTLLKTARHQQALTAFERALAYSPDYLPARQGIAIALYQLKNYEKAIATFETILQEHDLTKEQKTIAMLYKATSLCQVRETAKARQVFAEMVKLTDDPQLQKIARYGCGIR